MDRLAFVLLHHIPWHQKSHTAEATQQFATSIRPTTLSSACHIYTTITMHRATTSAARCPQLLLSRNTTTYAPSQSAHFSNKSASPMKSSRTMTWTQDSLTASSSWAFYQQFPVARAASKDSTATSGKKNDCSSLGMSSSFTWPPKGYQFNPITGRLSPLKESAHVKRTETYPRSKTSTTKSFIWHDGEVEPIRQSNNYASSTSSHLTEDPLYAESVESSPRKRVPSVSRTGSPHVRSGMYWQDGEAVRKSDASHPTTAYQPSPRLFWETGDAFTNPSTARSTSSSKAQSSPGRHIFWENATKSDEASKVEPNSLVGDSIATPSARLHRENDSASPNSAFLDSSKMSNSLNRISAEQNFAPRASGKLFWDDDVSSPTGPVTFNTTPSQKSGRLFWENDSKPSCDGMTSVSTSNGDPHLPASPRAPLDAAQIWKQILDLQTRSPGRASDYRLNFTITPSGQVKNVSVDDKPATITSTHHSTSNNSSASMNNA